jgi:hypothetical protein
VKAEFRTKTLVYLEVIKRRTGDKEGEYKDRKKVIAEDMFSILHLLT